MICPKCGMEIPNVAHVCPYCHLDIDKYESELWSNTSRAEGIGIYLLIISWIMAFFALLKSIGWLWPILANIISIILIVIGRRKR